MTTEYRSGIKGTFAIYSGDNDRFISLPSSLAIPNNRFASPLAIDGNHENGSLSQASTSHEMDPLVVVVQLKKELDDERRRFEHEREELQAALTSARSVSRREVEAMREATREAEASAARTEQDLEAEKTRRREAETAWTSERRSLKEEVDQLRSEVRSKKEELQESEDRLRSELTEAEAKSAATSEALQREQSTRLSREALAEKKFAVLKGQLVAAQEAREATQRSTAAEATQWRRELDEARMRHADVCQQLVDLEQQRVKLIEQNRLLSEEVEAAFAAAEEEKRRLESEWRAHLSAELAHAREEASLALEEEQQSYRAQVKKLETDYRARLDEAKQRLVTILRQKKGKYTSIRAELEEKVKKLQNQLKAEKQESAQLRARLARMLGRASGIIEDHCSTTKRLITDGHDSAVSIYSGVRDDDRQSLMSEVWSLPTGVDRPDSPTLPYAPRCDL